MAGWIALLAEGKVSPAIDISVVYRCLFLGEKPVKGHEVYCDTGSFLSVTYVTPGLRQYVEDFLGRLARGESAVYLMPAFLGAGKSHFLAFILHLVRLYGTCGGRGKCVEEELRRRGISLDVPDLDKVPRVAVFRATSELGELEQRLRNARKKEELRALISRASPLVVLLDETQYYDQEPGFTPWIQALAEVTRELGGVYLFVSYSLFSEDKPQLGLPASMQVVERVEHITVHLDTVDNIVHIFRRWAGVGEGGINPSPLRGLIDDKKLADFEMRARDTYPFNPVFLSVVKRLADESLVGRSKIQLTRELLRILAKAFLASGGGLATFAHLPEPEEVVVPGGVEAVYWKTLLDLYKEDVKRLSEERGVNKAAALSVLRHVLLSTFLARLLPSEILYPAEEELLLGSFDAAQIMPLDIRVVLDKIGEAGLHIARLGNRYLYWFVGDEVEAIRRAMDKFSDGDGLEVVTEIVAEAAGKKGGVFDKILISSTFSGARGKTKVINDAQLWQKELEEADSAVLAVDLRGFGVARRRNNLFYIKPAEGGGLPEELRAQLYRAGLGRAISARSLKDLVVSLGRFYKAAEEVRGNLRVYFPDLLSSGEDERIKAEMERILAERIERWREAARGLLAAAVNHWLRSAFDGFSNREELLDKYLSELSRRKGDLRLKIADLIIGGELFERWDNFKKLGDLWSLYLNNEKLPAAPISFDEFREAVEEFCRAGCRCVFQVDEEIKWLSESGCEAPSLDKDVGVAPLMWKSRLNEWAIEAFLKQLVQKSTKYTRYFILYKKPTGEEVKKAAEDLLASRGEWPYLNDGKTVVERVERAISVVVDGVEAAVVERRPGEEVTVEVKGGEELADVAYRLIGEHGGVVEERRGGRVFRIEAPKTPGAYKLEVVAEFRDGARDVRAVLLKVRGRCRKEVLKIQVAEGDRLRRVEAISVGAAEDLVKYFVGRGLGFRFELSASKSGPQMGEELAVEAKVPRALEKAQSIIRLLKSVSDFTQSVKATFIFEEPVQVDGDMAQRFKGYSLSFWVEAEEEC